MEWTWIANSIERVKHLKLLQEGDYVEYFNADMHRYRYGMVITVVDNCMHAYFGDSLKLAQAKTERKNWMSVGNSSLKFCSKIVEYKVYYKDGGGNNDLGMDNR